MRTLLLVTALAACSKTEKAPASPPPASKAQPQTMQGDTASKFDPAKLPPPGTAPAPVVVTKELDSIWDIPLKTVQGKAAKLADFKGKEILVVNVASQCGNTPQYATLEALQKKYEAKGFTVVGFPCNQFGGQEPGSSEEIATFCSTNYGVTFPIMEKVEVNGANRSDIYKALTAIPDAGGHSGDIRWNFEKFVVSADGTKVTRFAPKTTPDDPKVIAAIENGLPR
ncbi:MAG TPA: glutathione peroxidase [Kofleriaceae bacterium]|nr:glutathione peroxidase [Kofleriaceae bacterium]